MAYQRKTRDEFVVQGNYGYGHGFEDECSEDTRKEARQRLREYRENGPGVYRLVRRRVRMEEAAR
jgi:hypothetical protein